MNELSWLLYFADVSSGIKGLSTVIIALSFLGCIGGFVFWAETDKFGGGSAGLRVLKTSIWSITAACLLIVFLPSRDTLYAIAASELGEEALKTETAGLAHEALKKWLREQAKGDYDGG